MSAEHRMPEIRIPHGALLIICDGRKAMMLTNTGTPDHPVLHVHETLNAKDNPASREQGTDRPGRVMQSRGGRRSSVEITDLHDQQEKIFLGEASVRLTDMVQEHRATTVVLVAPPRALAVLREKLGDEIRALVVAEIDKDFTKHPIPDIQRLLTSA